MTLLDQRCFNHDLREAVAQCPSCKRFFCRECVTEHADGKGALDRHGRRRPADRLAGLLLFGLDAGPHPFEISRSLLVSAIDLLEEAVNLLRGASLESAVTYLIGAAPLTLGYLFFLTDMNRSPYAFDHLPLASLGLAFLYVWKNSWQAIFMAKLYRQLSPSEIRAASAWQAV